MKILNREPTEEMIKAGGKIGTLLWQDMYDAAPEIKVDMEPVAYLFGDHTWTIISAIARDHRSMPVYSAEQVAALQVENDNLSKMIKAAQDSSNAAGLIGMVGSDAWTGQIKNAIALQAQLSERDKTILEQQARIRNLVPFAEVFENFTALEAALKAERLKEREECAKLIEDSDSDSIDPRDAAEAIRARTE